MTTQDIEDARRRYDHAVANALREANERAKKAEDQLSYVLPEDYDDLHTYIRDIIQENTLFTYQGAEKAFLLREILQSAATHQGWAPIEVAFATRIRAVLDEPNSAPERERQYRDMFWAERERAARALE